VSGLKLFHTTSSGVTEVAPRLAEAEADVQRLVEAHMKTLLGERVQHRAGPRGPDRFARAGQERFAGHRPVQCGSVSSDCCCSTRPTSSGGTSPTSTPT